MHLLKSRIIFSIYECRVHSNLENLENLELSGNLEKLEKSRNSQGIHQRSRNFDLSQGVFGVKLTFCLLIRATKIQGVKFHLKSRVILT